MTAFAMFCAFFAGFAFGCAFFMRQIDRMFGHERIEPKAMMVCGVCAVVCAVVIGAIQ